MSNWKEVKLEYFSDLSADYTNDLWDWLENKYESPSGSWGVLSTKYNYTLPNNLSVLEWLESNYDTPKRKIK